MNKLVTLFKNQYLNQSSFNALLNEKNKKKKHRLMGVYFAYIVLFITLVVYSFLISYGYCYLNMSQAVPGYCLMTCALVSLIFTFIKTNGFLFAFKDYDLLMSLPVSTKNIITSKFLYMYINNLILSLCVMIPMSIGYGIFVQPKIYIYIIWFIVTCFTPLIPMTIASAIGAIIAAVGSKSKYKVFIQALLTLLIVIAGIGLNVLLQGSGSDAEFFSRLEDLGKVIQSQVHAIYPISYIFDQAVNDGSISSALLFLGLSLIIYAIFVTLVSIRYKKINSALLSSSSHTNYKFTALKTNSVTKALIIKEFKKFTSSVVYLCNVGIGMVLAVIVSGICLFMGIDSLLNTFEITAYKDVILYAIPFMIATPLCMTCTTSVSLSLEGKNLWILKSLPLTMKQILQSKMLFNLCLLFPASLICNICLIISLHLNIIQALLFIIISLSAICFSTTFGMWANVSFPNYNWENEVEVVKQGAASMLGILVNMVIQIAMSALIIILSLNMNGMFPALGVSIVLYVVAYVFYRLSLRCA